MDFQWPPGFDRVPDEPWTSQELKELALDYDTVENHGWYANLDPTVEEVAATVDEGDLLIDYSGGTGILMDRLLSALPETPFGLVNVDSSRKFLRLALEKLGHDQRTGYRLIRYLKDHGRLQYVDEVLGEALVERGVDGIISTNAIHLYYGLDETLASWHRTLAPGAKVFVQSGNIGLPDDAPQGWIIDNTVHAVAEAAERVVAQDDRYAAYRAVLDDSETMGTYRDLRNKYFLPVRPLAHYTDALEAADLRIDRVVHRPITARTDEWLDFLSVYHEGVLGWVGGAEKVTGREPDPAAVDHRLELLERGAERVFEGKETFQAVWTYITCTRT